MERSPGDLARTAANKAVSRFCGKGMGIYGLGSCLYRCSRLAERTKIFRSLFRVGFRLPGVSSRPARLECSGPDISYPFCCDLLRARLAALASRTSTDSMFPYSPTPNRFARLARRALAASRDENV